MGKRESQGLLQASLDADSCKKNICGLIFNNDSFKLIGMKFWRNILFVVICLSSLTGCWENINKGPETEETAYKRGQRLLKEGRSSDALESFLKVIAKRPDAPESHLEAGRLYLDFEKDPVTAIYHFKAYLREHPKTPQAPMVRQLIQTAQKSFAKSLPGEPFSEEFDRLDLLDCLSRQRLQIETLQAENATLKERLASVALPVIQKPLSTATVTPPKKELLQPPVAETYIVQSGDTLSKISTKVYGSPGRWKEIYEANRQDLKNAHDLRLGQMLRIP